MAFKNSLKIYLEKGFFSFAGRRLASGPPAEAGPARQRSPAPLQPTSPWPSPARWLLLPRAAPVAAPRPDRVRTLSPRGDHALASPAARQPRPAPAPTRPPSTATASALAHSRPRCLPSPPEPKAQAPPLAAPTHPLAKFVADPPPQQEITRPQLRLALLQVALALAPPSELRLSLPELRHRRPWRRRAWPPWKSTSFSSPAPPSYPTALTVF